MTIEELFSVRLRKPDALCFQKAKERWDSIAKPIDGLGDLEEIICRIAAIRGSTAPDLTKKALIIMCADNGVVIHGVSQSTERVTCDVAALMGQRRSSVCVMAGNYALDILTVDVGIACGQTPPGVIDKKVRRGTADFLTEPAMTVEECLRAVETGIDMAQLCSDRDIHLIATGEMGIGNTTSSTALVSALTGIPPEDIVGRGAGLSDEGLQRKLAVIREGLSKHFGAEKTAGATTSADAFEALRRVGGLDIAGLAGVFIGGAMCGIPVVIDGFISAAAALCAELMVKGCRDHMIASHTGRERGTGEVLGRLMLKPVIDANMALGEGSGAILLLPILDMAMSLYTGGTRFGETEIPPYRRTCA